MEEKKQLLIALLDRLQGSRPLAEAFVMLFEQTEDEVLINEVYDLMKQVISGLKSQQIRVQIKNHIKHLKEKEKLLAFQHEQEANQILDDVLTTLDE